MKTVQIVRSTVENTHAVENFFRAKIEDVKGIGKGSKGAGNTVSDKRPASG
ncbi:hypothetical protein SPD48_05655 [Pseudogracilibacillus sp. SE30717A]|uniref:hypothetical protein n=1 Tax=Pseudogracilibacillus sp. SE30717A TaxID=3098293 RepID=UPI00300DFA71